MMDQNTMWNHTGNILLHKDDVGKAKPPTYNLPADGYAYGAYNRMPEKGVRESNLAFESQYFMSGSIAA